MVRLDALIVGGGPAGSTCARLLAEGGLKVLVLERERFPRVKPCAGWITPEVVMRLRLDLADYCRGRILQEIGGFRTGMIGGTEVVTRYNGTVSYAIRRSEFDAYLLHRSRSAVVMGEKVAHLERKDGVWRVNGTYEAPLLVGAGGHWCPVARETHGPQPLESLVVAVAAEIPSTFPVDSSTAALFFSRDLKGYGWIVPKREYLNIGLGRLDRHGFRHHLEEFSRFLHDRGHVGREEWEKSAVGHAYLVAERGGRSPVGEGMVLVGDAVGLADARSGEGILPAVESAEAAARVLLLAAGDYRQERLQPYAAWVASRRTGPGMISSLIPRRLREAAGAAILSSQWLTRSIVLDRWFLHRNSSTIPA